MRYESKTFWSKLNISYVFMAGCGEDKDGREPTPSVDSTMINPS